MQRERASDTIITVDLIARTCGGCGVAYAMSETTYRARQRDHKPFWCPNGCERHFCDKSDIEKLREEVEAQRSQKEYWQQDSKRKSEVVKRTERRLSATRGVLTKVKKRICNGVCPDCNRHFANLERHMKTKHGKDSHD